GVALADLLDMDQRRGRVVLPLVGGLKLLLRADHRHGQVAGLARGLEVCGIPLARHLVQLALDRSQRAGPPWPAATDRARQVTRSGCPVWAAAPGPRRTWPAP